mgnify:CR=1 FL=1
MISRSLLLPLGPGGYLPLFRVPFHVPTRMIAPTAPYRLPLILVADKDSFVRWGFLFDRPCCYCCSEGLQLMIVRSC